MIPPQLIVVADRGQFRAFQVDHPSQDRQTLRLLKMVAFDEARERYSEKVTDQAGSFPNAASAGQGNSIAERMTFDAEEEMRAFRRVAQELISLLDSCEVPTWAFAAPSEINGAILDGIPERYQDRLQLNLRRDLVNVPASELLAHFESAERPEQ